MASSTCDTSLSSTSNRAHVYQDNDMGASAAEARMNNNWSSQPPEIISSHETVPAAMTAIDSSKPFQQTRELEHNGSLDIHRSPVDDGVHGDGSKKRKAEEKNCFYVPLKGESEPRNVVSEVDTTDSSTTSSMFPNAVNASRSSSLGTCSSDDTPIAGVVNVTTDGKQQGSGDETVVCGTESPTMNHQMSTTSYTTTNPSSNTSSSAQKKRKVTPRPLPLNAKKEGVVVTPQEVGPLKAAPPLLSSTDIPILPKPEAGPQSSMQILPHSLVPIVQRQEYPETKYLSVAVANTRPPSSKKGKTKCSTERPKTSRRAPRRPLPMVKVFIDEPAPLPQDVVSGRGGRSNHHPGNQWFWQEILDIRQQYLTADNDWKKNEIAKTVWRNLSASRKNSFMITADGARVPVPQPRPANPGDKPPRETALFVQVDKETKKWFIVPEAIALDKIKQALRDKYVPQWAIRVSQKVGGEQSAFDLEIKNTNKSRLPFPAERVLSTNNTKAPKKPKKAKKVPVAIPPSNNETLATANLLMLMSASEKGRRPPVPAVTQPPLPERPVSPPPPVWYDDGVSHSSSEDDDDD